MKTHSIDPNLFWGKNHYKNPPLTDSMIVEAERILRVRLPIDYLSLLRIQNGGYTKDELAFPLVKSTTNIDDCITLRELNGIVLNTDIMKSGVHNLLLTEYMTKEWDLPPRQVLLCGDGHTWISLDYRKRHEPSVVWLDAEMQREKPIAATFAKFFSALRPTSQFPD